MFRNYFKIALRQLRKNKGFSLLNILGLSLGLGCAILILLWIQDEVSYNRTFKKYDTVCQVLENQHYEGKIYTFSATPGLLASAMKTELPEVKNATRMDWGNRWLFTQDEKPVYENGNCVDPGFFDLFTIDFLYGSARMALLNYHSMVITETMSEKFFGKENPVGRTLKANGKEEFVVTGVIKDLPVNNSLGKLSWLVSFTRFEKENSWWENWGSNGMQTFVEVKPGTDLEKFNKKFSQFIKGKNNDASARPFLFPMKDWRLRNNFEEGVQTGGRIEYVKLFGIIAVLLIFIACINFMNLATARSEQRAREVGVRKVLGAERKMLVRQFMSESMIMSVLAMLFSCVLVLLALPFFNELVGKKLSLGLSNPAQWILFVGIALLCGILSGSYPALYLSSFKPVSIFKGMMKGGSSRVVLVRKSLVVTQFVISIVLIVSTVVVYKQIDHVKNRQLGYNKNNLIYINQNGAIHKNMEVIRQELLATGAVSHVAASNQRIMEAGNNTGGFSWEGKDPSKDVLITTEYVSSDYIKTAGMKLAAGRDFYANAVIDSSSCIINETFAKLLNTKDPVNAVLSQGSSKYTVVGVVKDFVYNDMYKKPDPFVAFCQPGSTNYLFIRFNDAANTEAALDKVEAVLKKHNPGYPFEYIFLDEDFNKRFKSEMLVSKLSRLFALLTIIISSLGLFGLAAYTAERRTKEIGVRKVLGASVMNVVSLLSKDFVKLVLLAIVIAAPIAWYVMSKWLEDYAYRISIQWWMFVAAGMLALAVALLTVSFQAIKAALTNPVKSLRTE